MLCVVMLAVVATVSRMGRLVRILPSLSLATRVGSTNLHVLFC